MTDATWNNDGSINWNDDLKNPRVAFATCAACGSDLVWDGTSKHWITFQDSKKSKRSGACAFHNKVLAAAVVERWAASKKKLKDQNTVQGVK